MVRCTELFYLSQSADELSQLKRCSRLVCHSRYQIIVSSDTHHALHHARGRAPGYGCVAGTTGSHICIGLLSIRRRLARLLRRTKPVTDSVGHHMRDLQVAKYIVNWSHPYARAPGWHNTCARSDVHGRPRVNLISWSRLGFGGGKQPVHWLNQYGSDSDHQTPESLSPIISVWTTFCVFYLSYLSCSCPTCVFHRVSPVSLTGHPAHSRCRVVTHHVLATLSLASFRTPWRIMHRQRSVPVPSL